MNRRHAIAFALCISCVNMAADSFSAERIAQVSIASSRITVADIIPNVSSEFAEIDLGPAPAPGNSRLITRKDLKNTLSPAQAASLASKIPAAIRVTRKTRKIDARELETLTREAIAENAMPKGASLVAVRPPASIDVPEGWDHVQAQYPKPPRRTGKFQTNVLVAFMAGNEILSNLSVPVEFTLTEEAVIADITKGSALTLHVERGLVEVAVMATANMDADIGSVLQVTVKPSGKVLRAKLVEKNRAIALDGQ